MAKTLIAFFSRADENYFSGAMRYVKVGNTEIVCNLMKEMIPADTFKIEMKEPYSSVYMTCIEEAKHRIGTAPIKKKLTDISAYDTIFIMSPIYWGTYAPEVETALEGLDFTGKTVRVISTHEGSGLAGMPSDIKKMCKGANVDMRGLAIKGSQAKNARQKVADWL